MNICQGERLGKKCVFVKNEKCTIEGGKCLLVIDKCQGCERIDPDGYCLVYARPVEKWKCGKKCNLSTHTVHRIIDQKKVNPLKESRRKAKKKK
jgi:hypothetical protein